MNNTKKRLLSVVMALMLVVSLLPVSAISAETVYTDVADAAALSAAIAEGENPKLTAAIALTEAIAIPAGTEITLDLNGKELTTGSLQITVSGSLTILDSGETGTVVSTARGSKEHCILVESTGTLHLEGGTFNMTGSSAAYCIKVTGGTATIENTTINATSTGSNAFPFYVNSSGKLTVNEGATLNALSNAKSNSASAIYCTNGTVTMNGGELIAENTNASTAYGIQMLSGSTGTIAGGTITATANSSNAFGIQLDGGSNATVTGGTIDVTSNNNNAYGIQVKITYTTTTTATTATLKSTTSASLTVPANSDAISITAHSGSSNAYGIFNEGITKLDSDKLTITASTAYTATSGTLKYVYALVNQNQMDISAGSFTAKTTSTTATKIQAFCLNNSAKTATVADKSGTNHTVTICKGTSNITGGTLTGTTTKATAAGVMTNNGEAVNISGDAQISGTTYAAWCYKVPINISGGTFTTNGTYLINIGTNGGKCTITGGTFQHGKDVFMISGGTLDLQGGKFVGECGRGAVDITHLLDPDKYVQSYDGTVTTGKDTPKFEVTAGGTTSQFISYWDAMAAVNADTTGNAKIKLLKDIYLGAAADFTTSAEVDLNGKTWCQSNGVAITVTAAGTENDVTRIVNGTLINNYKSVVVNVRAGALQLDGVTAYGHETMPVCYYAETCENTEKNIIRNSNLITNRYYTFSYRNDKAAQTDLNVLFENTNLINLYSKAAGGEMFFTGYSSSTGQFTLGEGVNMYAVYGASTLQRQNSDQKNSSGNWILMTAGTEPVKAVAAEGSTIHDRLEAATYSHVNAILEQVQANLDADINTSPVLYKWSTDHTHVNGVCACGHQGSVAKVGDTEYETLSEALDEAPEGSTVTLTSDITSKEHLLVEENVTLDLNGMAVNAGSLAVFGTLVDGTTGGNTLIKVKSFYCGSEDGFLPIYDKENGGYRVYSYQVDDLGYKNVENKENAAKFGFRLTLDNAEGYALLANGGSELTMTIDITCSGKNNFTMLYPIKASTLETFGDYLAQGLTNKAITLTISGLNVLGAGGTVTMTPKFATNVGMSVEGAGAAWSANS